MPDLIITNGDIAAGLLEAAGRDGTILPWRDILHEGPIVAGPMEGCSRLRAEFLSQRFRLDPREIAADFVDRDAVMRAHADFENIELWFEHDLYDQLQLIQLLSFFSDEARTEGLVLVQADAFLGAERADTILRFAERARPVTEADLDLADLLWADLAMPTPQAIARGMAEPTERLPFVAGAIGRFLEELPASGNGLGRTEQVTLAAIAEGVTSARDLFRLTLAKEEAAFMGDLSFFALLDDLAFAATPLLTGLARPGPPEDDGRRVAAARLTLTEAGRSVLAREADHVALNGVDRWWAGTRLIGRDVWRYNRSAEGLVPPASSDA